MSTNSVHRYIIAYDITSDARRLKIATALESYGDRVQYSVFLVDAKSAKLLRLHTTVRNLIDSKTDSIIICDLGPLGAGEDTGIEVLGAPRRYTGQGPLVL
ncbi:MAG TPA: CRISPR-associated endonuclease Cas2 [Pseudonocardia sp.]|uniref:CRISPR-associated endonuclease Cas2 n=1 Tax=Pseudonocardia sp. TaxID=60912 RepID=UPI002F402DD1